MIYWVHSTEHINSRHVSEMTSIEAARKVLQIESELHPYTRLDNGVQWFRENPINNYCHFQVGAQIIPCKELDKMIDSLIPAARWHAGQVLKALKPICQKHIEDDIVSDPEWVHVRRGEFVTVDRMERYYGEPVTIVLRTSDQHTFQLLPKFGYMFKQKKKK